MLPFTKLSKLDLKKRDSRLQSKISWRAYEAWSLRYRLHNNSIESPLMIHSAIGHDKTAPQAPHNGSPGRKPWVNEGYKPGTYLQN